MIDIKRTIEQEDIEWEMDWNQTNENGNPMFPNKPEKETEFEESGALALLLLNEVVFLNANYMKKQWPEEDRKLVSVNVICNDVFAWGCSDLEPLPYAEIENLYRFWIQEPMWGSIIWCLIQRREMPQEPVANLMVEKGWDLEQIQKDYNLRNNAYDGISAIIAERKYNTYCDWARKNGKQPLPFDKNWWAGWHEFVNANPNWFDENWEKEEQKAIDQWKKDNGFFDF